MDGVSREGQGEALLSPGEPGFTGDRVREMGVSAPPPHFPQVVNPLARIHDREDP
jgi:hypothetical protein